MQYKLYRKYNNLSQSPSRSQAETMSQTLSPHNHNHLKSQFMQRQQSSSQDSEQQLRTLIHIIEEYQQHYFEMLDQHKETIRDTANFDDFINKVKLRTEHQVQMLYEGMKGTRRMLEEMFAKCMALLPDLVRDYAESKAKVQYLSEQLDDKELVIEGLKQNKLQTEKHLREITSMYEKIRSDNLELNDKMNQKQQQFETESREIRKTFMQVTESSQIEKKILSEMYESNEKLSNSILQLKNDKKSIQKQLQKLTLELTKSNIRIQVLEAELFKKQNKLRECEAEMESIYMSNRKQSVNSMGSAHGSEEETYIRQSFNQQFDDRKTDKTKLNEELCNYKMPSVKELNGSFIMGSGIKRSIGQESDYTQYQQQPKTNKNSFHQYEQPQKTPKNSFHEQQPAQFKKKQIFDPYFSHYILISQSVKIKEDCQDMLNIDMKPYYEEIIQKRIPMHLWDQWVKNRLRELLRQNYPSQ